MENKLKRENEVEREWYRQRKIKRGTKEYLIGDRK